MDDVLMVLAVHGGLVGHRLEIGGLAAVGVLVLGLHHLQRHVLRAGAVGDNCHRWLLLIFIIVHVAALRLALALVGPLVENGAQLIGRVPLRVLVDLIEAHLRVLNVGQRELLVAHLGRCDLGVTLAATVSSTCL